MSTVSTKKKKFAQIPSRSAMENRKTPNFRNAFPKFAQLFFLNESVQIVSLKNNSFELWQLLYEYTEHNPSRDVGDGKVRVPGLITSMVFRN